MPDATFFNFSLVLVVLAAALDVLANMLLARSDGFRRQHCCCAPAVRKQDAFRHRREYTLFKAALSLLPAHSFLPVALPATGARMPPGG